MGLHQDIRLAKRLGHEVCGRVFLVFEGLVGIVVVLFVVVLFDVFVGEGRRLLRLR